MTDTVTSTNQPATTGEHWFARLGRFSVRRRRPLMLFWLVVALAAAPLAITVSGALSGAGWEAQGSIAQQVRDELRNDFPQVGAEAAVVVIHQDPPIADDPAAVHAVVTALTGAEDIQSTTREYLARWRQAKALIAR